MLKNVIDKKLFAFYDKAENWEDAIVKSCSSLVETGVVSAEYSEELVSCVKKYGPYIVLEDGIAMPHSTQEGKNVFKTEIAFTKFEEEVIFDEENKAKLFFTLASENPDVHLENIQKLMEVLGNDELKEELFKISTIEELKELSKKYNI